MKFVNEKMSVPSNRPAQIFSYYYQRHNLQNDKAKEDLKKNYKITTILRTLTQTAPSNLIH